MVGGSDNLGGAAANCRVKRQTTGHKRSINDCLNNVRIAQVEGGILGHYLGRDISHGQAEHRGGGRSVRGPRHQAAHLGEGVLQLRQAGVNGGSAAIARGGFADQVERGQVDLRQPKGPFHPGLGVGHAQPLIVHQRRHDGGQGTELVHAGRGNQRVRKWEVGRQVNAAGCQILSIFRIENSIAVPVKILGHRQLGDSIGARNAGRLARIQEPILVGIEEHGRAR